MTRHLQHHENTNSRIITILFVLIRYIFVPTYYYFSILLYFILYYSSSSSSSSRFSFFFQGSLNCKCVLCSRYASLLLLQLCRYLDDRLRIRYTCKHKVYVWVYVPLIVTINYEDMHFIMWRDWNYKSVRTTLWKCVIKISKA